MLHRILAAALLGIRAPLSKFLLEGVDPMTLAGCSTLAPARPPVAPWRHSGRRGRRSDPAPARPAANACVMLTSTRTITWSARTLTRPIPATGTITLSRPWSLTPHRTLL